MICFLTVEDTFYVDTRVKEDEEFAEKSLKTFAADATPPGQAAYAVKKMEDTYLGDLHVRPGVKYLFCHCGDCEHAMVFTQIFRATPRDRLIPRGGYMYCVHV